MRFILQTVYAGVSGWGRRFVARRKEEGGRRKEEMVKKEGKGGYTKRRKEGGDDNYVSANAESFSLSTTGCMDTCEVRIPKQKKKTKKNWNSNVKEHHDAQRQLITVVRWLTGRMEQRPTRSSRILIGAVG
jgi:hypothetical protein